MSIRSTKNLSEDIFDWAENFPDKLDDLEGLLTENRIFKQRNVDIGVVSKSMQLNLGSRELCLEDLECLGT